MGDCGADVEQPAAQLTSDRGVPSAETDEEVSVLVTGFGPFKTNAINASFLIASSLPSSLKILPAIGASSDGSVPASRVSIHVHPTPIKVAYATVRKTIPAILKDYAKAHGGRRPDIIIHIGIAATRNYYSVETHAHRDSYYVSDVNGKLAYEDGEKLWKELGLPEVLEPGPSTSEAKITTPSTPATSEPASLPPRATQRQLNPYPPENGFLGTWKSFIPSADLRISKDAGRYLCEFIFYTSLARAYLEGQDRNVLFLHVPSSYTDEDIEYGKDVTVALIKALVTRWIVG